MISAFVHQVAESGSDKSKKPLSAKTLLEYAKAAETWCSAILHLNLRGALSEKGIIHPFLAEVVAQRRAWDKPRSKKEPITMEMFENAQRFVIERVKNDRAFFLSRPATVHNFACLSTFTGSRAGEYAQTKAKRGTYNRIPCSTDAGEWAGMPLAFIRSDFTFWSTNGSELNKTNLHLVRKQADEVYIRFRYDKSLNNFTIRKFKRTGHPYLCPVLASCNILFRANLLGVPSQEPIGAFRLQKNRNSGYTFLTNDDVTSELRSTCLRTYPEASHYMNINHKCIMAHSGGLTAAVALYTAGQTYETIAFRLRWSVQSVQHYIRERCQHIGNLCQAVLTGAGRI